MTNYNEILKNEKITLNEVMTTYASIKEDISNNVEIEFDMNNLLTAVKNANNNSEENYYSKAILSENPFEYMIINPSFDVIRYDIKTNNVVNTNSKGDTLKKLAKIAKLEKAYQLYKSDEVDKFGKPIPKKSATVFLTTKYYNLCSCFVRHLFTRVLTVDNEKIVNLEKIKIDGVSVFSEKDGECFASNSYNQLEKQLNIIVKFFKVDDVQMLKKDVKVVEAFIHKAKINTDGYISIKENDCLKIADVILAQIRHKKADKEYIIG